MLLQCNIRDSSEPQFYSVDAGSAADQSEEIAHSWQVDGGDWNEVHKQIDIVRISIRYATQIMNQPTLKHMPKMHM